MRLFSAIALLLIAQPSCNRAPDSSAHQESKVAPEATASVDQVLGTLYARTLEYALRNHHPGGRFSLAHWNLRERSLALPEPFLNRILSISDDLRELYVPPERLNWPPPREADGLPSSEPLRDAVDGEEIFLYALGGMNWSAPSTVSVEYTRFRAAGDSMWQRITLQQIDNDWQVVDEGRRLGDNYNNSENMRFIESRVLPITKPSKKSFNK